MDYHYRQIAEKLASLGSSNEIRTTVRMLLQDLCGLSGNEVYAGKDIKIPSEKSEVFEDALLRLSAGEPIQYVLGRCEFYSHIFNCRQPVLIPRPETEELVDWILQDIGETNPDGPATLCCNGDSGKMRSRLLDVGTGSGCIAVSLACGLPSWQVDAWDILPEALSLARENAERLGADVRILEKDLFAEAADEETVGEENRYDIIVSNPPYVCRSEAGEMSERVLGFESHEALFVPDEQPLRYYEALAALGRRRLRKDGRIYLEINSRFGAETVNLLEKSGYEDVELRQDLFGRDRMIRAVAGSGFCQSAGYPFQRRDHL